MIVLLATRAEAQSTAEKRFVALGAPAPERRATGDGHTVLAARVPDERESRRIVSQLRAEGFFATERPEGGGHLSAWRHHHAPVDVGGRALVCFPWAEFERPAGLPVVEIDPDRGFGTGAHPSTRMLLGELARRLQGGESVLDVGCGSGVLALCAAALGATHVTAIDTEPAALAATRANIEHNRLAHAVHVSPRSLSELPGRFDVILANVAAGTLIELAAQIAIRLAPDGWIGLSGLSPAQVSLVEQAYRPLVSVARPVLDDWAATVLAAPELASEPNRHGAPPCGALQQRFSSS